MSWAAIGTAGGCWLAGDQKRQAIPSGIETDTQNKWFSDLKGLEVTNCCGDIWRWLLTSCLHI